MNEDKLIYYGRWVILDGKYGDKEDGGIRQVRPTSLLTNEALPRVRRNPTRHCYRGTPWRKTRKNQS